MTAIGDLIQPKQKAKIGQLVVFGLQFDAVDMAFTGGKVNFRFMAADNSENESEAIPVGLMPFTPQQRDTVEAIFADVITQFLANEGFTVEPDIVSP
jgi:hypothetical protein